MLLLACAVLVGGAVAGCGGGSTPSSAPESASGSAPASLTGTQPAAADDQTPVECEPDAGAPFTHAQLLAAMTRAGVSDQREMPCLGAMNSGSTIGWHIRNVSVWCLSYRAPDSRGALPGSSNVTYSRGNRGVYHIVRTANLVCEVHTAQRDSDAVTDLERELARIEVGGE